jgi:hypothetical protein
MTRQESPTQTLLSAARSGNATMVAEILKDNTDIDSSTLLQALKSAQENMHHEVVRTIIASGRVNVSSEETKTEKPADQKESAVNTKSSNNKDIDFAVVELKEAVASGDINAVIKLLKTDAGKKISVEDKMEVAATALRSKGILAGTMILSSIPKEKSDEVINASSLERVQTSTTPLSKEKKGNKEYKEETNDEVETSTDFATSPTAEEKEETIARVTGKGSAYSRDQISITRYITDRTRDYNNQHDKKGDPSEYVFSLLNDLLESGNPMAMQYIGLLAKMEREAVSQRVSKSSSLMITNFNDSASKGWERSY